VVQRQRGRRAGGPDLENSSSENVVQRQPNAACAAGEHKNSSSENVVQQQCWRHRIEIFTLGVRSFIRSVMAFGALNRIKPQTSILLK
jgi:hypothetical protein